MINMNSVKVTHKWTRILIVFSLTIVSVYVGVYFFINKEMEYRYNYNKSDKYYAYDKNGELSAVYGVRSRYDINNMLNYYEWKLNDKEYIYDDISMILEMPFNTVVYVQKYLRDSTIVYVAFVHYNSYKKDSVTWNYYIPRSMLHKMPFEED